MPEIKVTVTKTAVVEMRPLCCFLYFDEDPGRVGEDGKPVRTRKARVQYGEYHDGVLARELALQDAPEDAAGPVLDAVYGAMDAKAKATLAGLATKNPADYDDNERYLAALLAAGQ